jgi:hypothetical protein
MCANFIQRLNTMRWFNQKKKIIDQHTSMVHSHKQWWKSWYWFKFLYETNNKSFNGLHVLEDFKFTYFIKKKPQNMITLKVHTLSYGNKWVIYIDKRTRLHKDSMFAQKGSNPGGH